MTEIAPIMEQTMIDISEWYPEDLQVIYWYTADTKVRAEITGFHMKQDKDGILYADLLCKDVQWSTGLWPRQMQPRGVDRKGHWEFVRPPKAIREMEAALSELQAEEAERIAKQKREQANKVVDRHDEQGGEQPVRGGGSGATKLRRVATKEA